LENASPTRGSIEAKHFGTCILKKTKGVVDESGTGASYQRQRGSGCSKNGHMFADLDTTWKVFLISEENEAEPTWGC
jgi:hypothetical protein